ARRLPRFRPGGGERAKRTVVEDDVGRDFLGARRRRAPRAEPLEQRLAFLVQRHVFGGGRGAARGGTRGGALHVERDGLAVGEGLLPEHGQFDDRVHAAGDAEGVIADDRLTSPYLPGPLTSAYAAV